ncbi:MAG: winged helix-turn-helix transcriptional regulator [Burkholderiaceae bacterium]|nr:winged helix-turn-helix transcriptional regulator [Burkholderiaceae bacterium]
MPDLDRIDRKILDLLQRHARLPVAELARSVGLSASPCAERVRRLEREGVITGYHARIAPEALGRTLLVFAEIRLAEKSQPVFDQVRRALVHVPQVLECHLVTGAFDYLLKARVRDMDEYRRLLGSLLAQLPVRAESHSYVVMDELKETSLLEIDR